MFLWSLLAAPLVAEAQTAGRVPRIGILASGATPAVDAFNQRLRELGYVDGRNLVVETGLTMRRLGIVDELA